jgi:secreted trypsin-like serine protease
MKTLNLNRIFNLPEYTLEVMRKQQSKTVHAHLVKTSPIKNKGFKRTQESKNEESIKGKIKAKTKYNKERTQRTKQLKMG